MLARRHNGSGMLPLSRRSEGAALRSHRPASRHPFLREAASGLGAGGGVSCPATAVQRTPPRTHHPAPASGQATIQRRGRLEGFEAFYKECTHPLFYNGDLHTANDIRSITTRFPRLAGIVIGRGLLANPAWRWNTSKEPRFLPMKWRKSGTTTHRGVRQLPRATARRRHATADENEKLLGISAAGRRP